MPLRSGSSTLVKGWKEEETALSPLCNSPRCDQGHPAFGSKYQGSRLVVVGNIASLPMSAVSIPVGRLNLEGISLKNDAARQGAADGKSQIGESFSGRTYSRRAASTCVLRCRSRRSSDHGVCASRSFHRVELRRIVLGLFVLSSPSVSPLS